MDIDVAALDRLLTASEQSGDVILDTRDPGAAARWHPEGPGARYLNVPYDEFEGDPNAAIARLPEDARNVHVLCARGLKLPGFRGHFPLCGEGSTNGQETSSRLSPGIPG